MNPFDLVVVILMVVLGVVGMIWGLVRMAATLAGVVLAFIFGMRWSSRGSEWFAGWIENPEWAQLAAFFAVFFGIMVGVAIFAYAMRRFLKAIHLGWADRLGGAAVGVAGALLIGAALTLPLTALPPAEEPVLQDSLLAPYTLYAADLALYFVPDELEEQYEIKKQALVQAWDESTQRADADPEP